MFYDFADFSFQIDESDGRKLEELETLCWKPHTLSDFQLDHYFAIAKSIGLFVQALDTCFDEEPNDCLEEEKCVHRPFEIPEIGTKNTLKTKSNNPSANITTTSPEKQSITTRQQRSQQQKPGTQQNIKDEPEPINTSPVEPTCSISPKPPISRLEFEMSSNLVRLYTGLLFPD